MTWHHPVLAALCAIAVIVQVFVNRDSTDTDNLHTDAIVEMQQEIDVLDERIKDLEYETDIANAAQMDAYLACYHDPDTEQWAPNLPIPAPGECP